MAGQQAKTALVIGGSGVFGSLLVGELSREGYRVLATASSNASAHRIPTTADLRLLLDLEDEASIATLANYLVASEPLDMVVVASGRVGFGSALETNREQSERLMQINYRGPAELLAKMSPALNPSAQLAVITGIVASRSFPGMSSYCASKAALSGWLSAVRQEWRRDGIAILEAQPGHTETGLAGRPLFGSPPPMPAGMQPDAVVARILSAIKEKATLLTAEDFA